MPNWPEEARAAAIAAIDNRAYEDGLDISVQQGWQLATDILDAAAPILAGARGVSGTAEPHRVGATRDPRARISCRRCGAQPGQQCVTSSGSRAPVVHAERRNDWRRTEGQTAGMMEAEGMHMDRFPPPPGVPGA